MGRPRRRRRAPPVTADHPVALRAGRRCARTCASIGQACPHPRNPSRAVRRLYTLLMEKRGPWFALVKTRGDDVKLGEKIGPFPRYAQRPRSAGGCRSRSECPNGYLLKGPMRNPSQQGPVCAARLRISCVKMPRFVSDDPGTSKPTATFAGVSAVSISHTELLERSNLSGLEVAPSSQGRGGLALQIGEHGLVLRSRRRIAGTHQRPQRCQHVV